MALVARRVCGKAKSTVLKTETLDKSVLTAPSVGTATPLQTEHWLLSSTRETCTFNKKS